MKSGPEPWSPTARSDPDKGKAAVDSLAGSLAVKRLVAKIERYIDGEFCGHAVLVAGHRGAGKTTATLAAMQTVYNRSRSSRCRPLLVRLHGPSLLVPVLSEGSVMPEGAKLHSLRFLQEMAAGIFPALAQELRFLFEAKTKELEDEELVRAREMIVHLLDEVSRGMPLAELRELFRRLKILPKGLLHGEAFAELSAINAAGEAYLVVTGKLGQSNNVDHKLKDEQKRSSTLSLAGSSLTKALTPVAASIAAAFGLANDSPGTALLATVAILLGGLTLSSTSTHDRTTDANRQRTFVRDNSLDSLVRRVPLLVDQLRSVGFPPVFVVDELDKISEPPVHELLDGLMRNIKSYVTERSLILFLVDRKYYDHIIRVPEEAGQRYGVEHTFYGDQVYVVSSAVDLHKFLRSALGEDEDRSEEGSPAHQRAAGRRSYAFVRHAILHRGRMHPYDVRSQFERSRDNGELQQLETKPARLQRIRVAKYEVFFQLCIEWVLSDASHRREIAAEPYYLQISNDILFGVSDRWKRGEVLRDSEEDERKWIEDRTTDAGQRSLIREALDEMTRYLRCPGELVSDVRKELDEVRLKLYLREGECEPETSDREEARRDLAGSLAGRDPEATADVFGTVKYALLREVSGELERVLGDVPDDFAPLIGPRGYSGSGPKIGDEEEARIARLLSLRELAVVDVIGFERLFSAATGGSPFSSLQTALEALAQMGERTNPTHRDTVQYFATHAPDTKQIIVALLLGVCVIAKIQDAEPLPKHLDMLLRAIQGEGSARFESASKVVTWLCGLHEVSLSAGAREMLELPRTDKVLEEIEAALDIPGTSQPNTLLRNQWEASLAMRMHRRLIGEVVELATVQRGTLLDLAAVINGWFPRTLRVWLELPEPSEWTIKIWSDILSDDRVSPVFSAFAAALLNDPWLTAGPMGSEDQRLEQWLNEHARRRKSKPLPFIVLVNPSEVMSKWVPISGFRTLAVDLEHVGDETVAVFRNAAVVFSELREVRPPVLKAHQYAVVADRSIGIFDVLSDGTPVLTAENLRTALKLHRQALRNSRSR